MGDKGRDIVFKEEFVSLPIVTIEGDQAPIQDIIQDANPKIQDNNPQLPVQHKEVALGEQPQQPQLEMPLRRSTRERRNAIPNDYIVYLLKYEFDIGVENDPINFTQAKQSSKSQQWIDAMEDEMKYIKDNDI